MENVSSSIEGNIFPEKQTWRKPFHSVRLCRFNENPRVIPWKEKERERDKRCVLVFYARNYTILYSLKMRKYYGSVGKNR